MVKTGIGAIGLCAILLMAGTSCSSQVSFAKGQISGFVYVSGPLTGAIVHAYAVDASGQRQATEVGESSATGADGSFSIAVGIATDTIYLEVTGAAMYEEQATGEHVAVDPGVALAAVALSFQPGEQRTGVIISGLTTMATSLGGARLAARKESSYSDAVQRAYELIGQHFFDIDVAHDIPADLTQPSATLTAEVRYALINAGLSQLARDIGNDSTPRLTANDANSLFLERDMADDLSSSEALFDGKGRQGKLVLGTCTPPPSCTGGTCHTICDIGDASPRGDLAAALIEFLNSPRNTSSLKYDDVAGKIMDLVADSDPDLFPTSTADAAPVDRNPPVVTFHAPTDGSAVSGTIPISVSATDDTQVASITLSVDGAAGPPDTDPAPGSYTATLDTTTLDDGPHTITATATDASNNAAMQTVHITVNNHGPGVITGQCIKAAIDGARVTAYQYRNAVKGPAVGTTATTDSSGRFAIQMIELYSGPVLVECGESGTYSEEAFDYTTTLSPGVDLRGVIELDTTTGTMVVTPWTTLATTYLEYLVGQGSTEADAHTAAYAAIAKMLDVADIGQTVPAPLNQTATTYSDETWTALTLAGLSQLAENLGVIGNTSHAGANAIGLVLALDADIADGCLDGKDTMGRRITYAGVALDEYELRYELAQAIGEFIIGGYNSSGLTHLADAYDRLNSISLDGPATATSGCKAGSLFADPGAGYDRTPPTIHWDATVPIDGTTVLAGAVLKATATDDVTAHPTLSIVAPSTAGITDDDNAKDSISVKIPATQTGTFTLALQASDEAGNVSAVSTRTYTVGNAATTPTITLDGVMRSDGWTNQSVTVNVTTPGNAPFTTTIDGMTQSVPHTVTAQGLHKVEVTATYPGGTTMASASFIIDTGAPTISNYNTFPEMYVNHPLDLIAVIDDNFKTLSGTDGSLPFPLTTTLDASATIAHGTPTLTQASVTDGRVTLEVKVPIDTSAGHANDGSASIAFTGQDRAGNVANTLTWTGIIDTTPPQVTVTEPPAIESATNPWVGSGTISATVTEEYPDGTKGPSGLVATIDGQTATFPLNLSTLAEGAHTLVVYAQDLAGNQSTTITRTFYVDRTVPIISLTGTPAAVFKGSFTYAGSMTDNLMGSGSLDPPNAALTAHVAMTGSSPPDPLATQSTSDHSLEIAPTSPITTTSANDGAVIVMLTGHDRAGNVATFVSWSGIIDNTAPTVTLMTSPAISATNPWTNASSVSVSATATDVNLLSLVTTIDGTMTTTAATGAMASFTSSLTSTGAHAYSASASDKAGNVAATVTGTPFTIDRDPPTINVLVPPPAYVSGSFGFAVSLTDGSLQSSGSLATTPATLSAKVVQSSGTATYTGMYDANDGSWGLTQSMLPATVDGPLTITITGEDRAGNTATKTLTALVDNTPPTVTLAALAASSTATATLKLSGTYGDTGSGVARIVIHDAYNGGADVQTLTITPQPGLINQPWQSATITLGEGLHTFSVTAYDAAGNKTTATTSDGLLYDKTPPTVRFDATHTYYYDERYMTITFNTVTGSPQYVTPSGMPPSGTAQLDGSSLTVYKYPANWGSPNHVYWRLQIDDPAIGPDSSAGSGVATVTYVVTPPAGAASSIYTATPDLGSNIYTVTDTMFANGTILDALKTQGGVFKVDITAVDKVGNSTAFEIQFTNHPLPPPLYITVTALGPTSAGGTPALDTADSFSAGYYSLEKQDMQSIVDGTYATNAGAGLLKVTIKNGTADAANVAFAIPDSLRTHSPGTYVENIHHGSVQEGAHTYSGPCGILPYNVATNTCYSVLPVTDTAPTGTISGSDLTVFATDGGQCTFGCPASAGTVVGLNTLATGALYEYKVVSGGTKTVILAMSNAAFLKQGFSGFADQSPGSTYLYGSLGTQFVQCETTVIHNGVATCTSGGLFQEYDAVTSATLTVQSPQLLVRFSGNNLGLPLEPLYSGGSDVLHEYYSDNAALPGAVIRSAVVYETSEMNPQ